MQRVLIVEDQIEIQRIVSRALADTYHVATASSLAEAHNQIGSQKFDLILLDVSLPDGNGYKFCAQLRNSRDTRDIPIIFLTGHMELTDKVMGFSLGADDYITKPFHLEELKARVDARLKRMRQLREKEEHFRVGNLRLDINFQKASICEGQDETPIDLTPIEFKILSLLAKNEEQVFSREQLMKKIWGERIHVSERAVDTHVSKLRKKIVGSSHTVKAVHGTGYKLCRRKAEGSGESPGKDEKAA